MLMIIPACIFTKFQKSINSHNTLRNNISLILTFFIILKYYICKIRRYFEQ